MPPIQYDPMSAPEPAAWLASSEPDRLRQVEAWHTSAGVTLPNAKLHAVAHVAVENQIAEGHAPTIRAMARLKAGGLDRHEALHAVGNVLSHHIFAAMKEGAREFDHTLYALELELLNLERIKP